ncbi:MAG TPA: DMT family transporter [Acidimicrobiales bacterium]
MRGTLAASLSSGAAGAASVLAVVSAFAYTLGLALQQKANLATVGAGTRRSTVWRVVSSRWWVLGFVLGVGGFVLHGMALAVGSLTLVQVLQVSQIVFMVPLSAWVARVALRRRDWVGGALVGLGLLGLLLALSPGQDTRQGTVGSWTAVSIGSAALVAILLVGGRGSRWTAPLYGAAAGIVFGVEAATLKVVSDDLQSDFSLLTALRPATGITLALAVFGVVIQNLALRAGSLSSAQASMTIATPILSAVIGWTVFGEHLDVGPATVAIGLACAVLAVAGVVLLSRSDALTRSAAPSAGAGTATATAAGVTA